MRRSTSGSMHKNSKKAESNTKIAQSPRKQFPKDYFTQSIVTFSRNPGENNFSIIFSRAQCFLNGGYLMATMVLRGSLESRGHMHETERCYGTNLRTRLRLPLIFPHGWDSTSSELLQKTDSGSSQRHPGGAVQAREDGEVDCYDRADGAGPSLW